MRRREFITLLGGAAASWPIAARAQQGDHARRIGVLLPGDENDPVFKARLSAFTQALADLGWTDGRNVRMELRWAGSDINRMRALAQELVGLQPDIILQRIPVKLTHSQHVESSCDILHEKVSE
jgi:putative ABC transport system substrate-binding protein